MLPLSVTPPFPFVSEASTPLMSALANVPVFNTSMTVDVSLYFADLPLSLHSKTCSESHEPDGIGASPSFVV